MRFRRQCGCRLLAAAAVLSAALLLITSRSGLHADTPPFETQQATAYPDTFEQQARAVCGTCHTVPPPDILPRHAWRDSFVRMLFIREGRPPLVGPPDLVFAGVELPPDMEALLPQYLERAPERLPPPDPWPDPEASPIRFVRHTLEMTEIAGAPAVSSVRLVDVDGDGRLEVIGSDMRQGVIFRGRPAERGGALSVVASTPYPARVRMQDVDGDGIQDLLVADLGSFFPEDHDEGSVIWLRGRGDGTFTAVWLDDWPRVADVVAADFNGNGRKDLGVAAFGWRKTGHVTILENRTVDPSEPEFVRHLVDDRSGSIDVIPADLNGDGLMDFVTVLAQEHETVVAYINKGNFTFERQVIYTAPHPNWGCSGIQLVDLDGDGDLDVLLAHGDTFDDGIVKPYHGIQWLENRGSYPFVAHDLAQMPGVHGIRAVDLDGSGRLDVVASALLARGADVDEAGLPALVWLQQTRPGVFVRHTIAMGFPRYATIDVGDVNGNGAVDIVAGRFQVDKPSTSWVDVWTAVGGR